MKEKTKKVLKGVFFFVSWIVDFVRWSKKKRQEKQESDNSSDQSIKQLVMKTDKDLKVIKKRASRTFYGRNVIPPCTLGVTLPGLGVDIGQIIKTQTIPNDVADVVYNDLKEISQVGFRVNNDFDLMMIAKGFKSLNIGLQSNVGTAASNQPGSGLASQPTATSSPGGD